MKNNMVNILKTVSNLLNSILPTSKEDGNTSEWNDDLKMYIVDQYTSKTGMKYYVGMRSSNRLVVVIHFTNDGGDWTHYNDIEVYAFDGKGRKLIGKTNMDDCTTLDQVRAATESLVKTYIIQQFKLNGVTIDEEELETMTKELLEQTMTR